MTINEAINYYSNLADDIDKNPLPGDSSVEPRQIAEWLEELKIFQELYPDTDVKSSLQKNYEQGRADEQDRVLSIVSRCIAHNVYNVSEGIALLNEIKKQLKTETSSKDL